MAAALALVFARDAYDYVAHPLARGMRVYSLTWLALLLSAAACLVLLARLRAGATTTSLKWLAWAVPAVLALLCCGPAALVFVVVDTRANARERDAVAAALKPLVDDLKAVQARSGEPPVDPQPQFERRLSPPPEWMLAPSRRSPVRYYRGPQAFVLAVGGTRFHRDDQAFVFFSSADGRWTWSDFGNAEGDEDWHRRQMSAAIPLLARLGSCECRGEGGGSARGAPPPTPWCASPR